MKQIIILLLITVLAACENKKVNIEENISTAKKISIDTDKSKKNLKYSDVFEKIDYVRIATSDDFLIGNIDKLIVSDTHFYIVDNTISRSVFCIDKGGNKVFEIRRFGNGPGEYIGVDDLAYDPEQQELIVYCRATVKLIYFNLQGEFLRQKKLPYQVVRVQQIKDMLALFSEYLPQAQLKQNSMSPNLILLDKNSNVKSTAAYFPNKVNKQIVWSAYADFSHFGNTLALKPDHSNTIYHVTDESIIPAYVLDFGEKYNIGNTYWNMSMEKGMTLEAMDDHEIATGLCESFDYRESDNYFYFMYRQKMKNYQVFHSKKSNELIQSVSLRNDMDFVSVFNPVAAYKDQFYVVVNPDVILNRKKRLAEINIVPELVESVKEFDNPIIAIFTLKEF
jgi:hypothetical protein